MNDANRFLTDYLAAVIKPIVIEAVREAFRTQLSTSTVASNKTFLTVKQCAEVSGLGISTIRLYLRRRKIPAQKIGRRILIKRSDLDRFLESNPTMLVEE